MSNDDKPTIPTRDELLATIDGLIAGVTDPDVAYGLNTDGYGKCVEAMWRAAYAVHEYVARELGVTGFQHSMSSLTLLGKLNHIDGPYMIVDATQALYPQYDLQKRVAEFLGSEDTQKWLSEEATRKLAEITPEYPPHPNVLRHWQSLAATA